MLKQGDNEFEFEIMDHDPRYVKLTTRHNNEDLYTDCDWSFLPEEFQAFVDWINECNRELNGSKDTD